MLNWLMLALVSGIPTGLQSSDLEEIVAGVSTDVHLLEPALERRVLHLLEAGRTDLAVDSLHVLGPLAERVGLAHQRAALEDEAFRLLEPEAYERLRASLPSPERDAFVMASLQEALVTSVPASAEVHGRVKSLWSLQKKLRRKQVGLDGIHDRLAFRVIVDDTQACYAVMDELLERFDAIPGEQDDYIQHPKPSGYQALHTAIRVPVDGDWVVAEVQMKTAEMHRAAEHGDAAHWRYKAA